MADEENHDEQTMEDGFLTKQERFDRAQRKFEYAKSLDLEAEAASEEAQSLKKQAKGARNEAEALICDKAVKRSKAETPDPQLSIEVQPLTVCPSETAAVAGEHEWERIRETDGALLDQCLHCLHERTAKIPEDGADPIWLYLPYEAAASSDSGETHAPETPVETASAAASSGAET